MYVVMVLPASDRRMDLIWACKQLRGPKLSAVHVLSYVCTFSLWACTLQWRLMMRVRLRIHRCTVEMSGKD